MNDGCCHCVCWTRLSAFKCALGQRRHERLIPIYRGGNEARGGEDVAPGHMVSLKMELGF